VILIFQRIFAHYRLGVFREINKVTGAILCFGKKGPKGTYLSEIEPDFSHLKIGDFYPFSKIDTLAFLDVFTPLFKFKPTVVVTEFALGIISNYLLLFFKPFLKYKLILWSHGYNRKKGFHPERSFADKLRQWWMNRADAVILYSQEIKKLISQYLKNPRKLFVAQNTLDTNSLTKIRNILTKRGKEKVKKELGFTAKYNLIFIGRLLKEKEPDRLIDVFRIIEKHIDSVELHIVGDGPLLEQLKIISKGLKVKFWGGITDDKDAGSLLFASDLMVMPGCVGLSVVHSFCFDCPVVSQKQGFNGPYHSPEIEYVEDGRTGFLIPYGDNNLMAEVIINYLLDEEKQKEMRKEMRNIVENICSIENMINGFKEAIYYVKRGNR